ncbi:MAG TPA: CBS domain-containing protein [Oligoflexia bacterium]|nr:CBS domain-containing protein [Oligoflexia bacterium]
MIKIRPSSAITLKSDTSIGEVVRVMRERKVGSLIITASTYPHQLVGIFTERDLVRWVHEITSGGFWDKPISTIMTKSLITVHISEVDQAAEVMVKNNIRHLPVVFTDDRGVQHLAGVLSMRDLFRRFVRGHTPTQELARGIESKSTANKKTTRIAVISNDRSAQAAIDGIVHQSKRYALQSIDLDALLSAVDGGREFPALDILIFDIDFAQTERWGFLLKSILKIEDGPKVLLIFDPLLHSNAEISAIKTLTAFENFRAMPKPLNLLDFFKRLRIWSGANG